MIKKGIQSLHSHTILSDGTLTHSQTLEIASKAGIKVLAFTDHDALPDQKLLKELKSRKYQISWLIGIEISAGLPKELGGGPKGPHMLGLFVDPFNKKLLEYCKKVQEEKLKRYKEIVKNLQTLGFDITLEEILKNTQGSLNRPHLVLALKSKEKNLKLIDEYIKKMKQDAQSNEELRKKYDHMMDLGENQYPYALFLENDSYKSVVTETRFWLDFDQSVELIRQAGGVAFVAHYTFSKKDLPWEALEKLLKENRVDGAETVYGLWNMQTNFKKEIDQDRQKIRQLLKKYKKLPVGGTDAHFEKDFYDFVKHQEHSEETVGMIEEIIKKFQISPDLVF